MKAARQLVAQNADSSRGLQKEIRTSETATTTRSQTRDGDRPGGRKKTALGRSPSAALHGPGHAALLAQLAAAVAAGDKDQVFVLAARIVASASAGEPKPVQNKDKEKDNEAAD